MAVSVNRVALRFLNVSAGVAVPVAMQAFEAVDVSVIYGIESHVAVRNVDYTITLSNDFKTFTITPTTYLIDKINALIAADPTERNEIIVRRELDYLTETTPGLARATTYVSRELERAAMRDQQLAEKFNRTISLSDRFIGDVPQLQIEEAEPGRALILDSDGQGIVAGPNAQDIQNAQSNADIATQQRILAEAAAARAETAVGFEFPTLRGPGSLIAHTGLFPTGTYVGTRSEQFVYVVLPAVDVTQDMTTVGGSKLRVVQNGARTHVKAWGAWGDNAQDDAGPIRKALNSGLPLQWGNSVYLIRSAMIIDNVSADWDSQGAKIRYAPAAATQRCIHFNMGLLNTFRSTGKLIIDANRLAFDGLSATSSAIFTDVVQSWPTYFASDIEVRNARRSSNAFSGGNGINILGGFEYVVLQRPVVLNSTMAAGAEVFGVEGVFGITIGRVTGSNPISPDHITIVDPYIDYVGSDDVTYKNDQDGIRIFGARTYDGLAPDNRGFVLRGGKIRNARNRSVKVQSQRGIIHGVTILKDNVTCKLVDGMTINPDIDWQISGGITRDIDFHYDQASPPEIVRMVSSDPLETYTTGTIQGLRGFIKLHSLATPPYVAMANSATTHTGTRHDVTIDDVKITGPVSCILRLVSRGTYSDRASVTNVSADIRTACFSPAGAGSGTAIMYAEKVWNRGTPVPIGIDISSNRIISAYGCTGFVGNDASTVNGEGQMLRVDTIGPLTPRVAGALRPLTVQLAAGEEYVLPKHGLNSGACLLLVSVGRSHLSNAIFSVGNGVTTFAAGSEWANGAGFEPSTGTYRIWFPTGDAVHIKNAGTDTRYFSFLLFG